MKFFAFIMAFLVLALSVMPCADSYAMDNKEKNEVSKSANQQDEDQQDECSPFCHCTCCAGFSVNHCIAAIATIPIYASNHLSSFLPSDIIGITSPIWQPPQLV